MKKIARDRDPRGSPQRERTSATMATTEQM